MLEIIYNPKDAGHDYMNSKGKISIIRKYHMTDEEAELAKLKWLGDLGDLELELDINSLKRRAGKLFFNPYRQGIYYYQIQTLFFLGANKWHKLTVIVKQLEQYTSLIKVRPSVVKRHSYLTAWDQFRGKRDREHAKTSKDYVGRIQENFVMLQRLSQRHPYGYKLHQVCAAIDIKRVSKQGFQNGLYYYRLSTYSDQAEAFPIKDFSKFRFPRHEGKYISRKFIGTIVTSKGTIREGVLV